MCWQCITFSCWIARYARYPWRSSISSLSRYPGVALVSWYPVLPWHGHHWPWIPYIPLCPCIHHHTHTNTHTHTHKHTPTHTHKHTHTHTHTHACSEHTLTHT